MNRISHKTTTLRTVCPIVFKIYFQFFEDTGQHFHALYKGGLSVLMKSKTWLQSPNLLLKAYSPVVLSTVMRYLTSNIGEYIYKLIYLF
jgi:hypothetical protein